MSNSMDDLLRQNDATAKKIADKKQADEQEEARLRAAKNKGHLAFQHVLDRVKAQVEEFNNRSTAGKITTREARFATWEFILPNTANVLTLKGTVVLPPKNLKGKTCGVIATLSENRGYGVHFLLLEDEKSPDNNEWVAVRVKYSGLAAPERRTNVEPFITTLDEISRGTNVMHVIEPEYSEDLDDAIREMIKRGLTS